MNYIAFIICLTIWNITIFSFFSYMIFFEGHSGWWYLFMMAIGGYYKSVEEVETGRKNE